MVLGQGSWIVSDVPHAIDNFSLRLALALIEQFLSCLVA